MTEEEKLLNTLCELQEKDPGCLMTLGKTPEGDLKYLSVQTSRMKENVRRYGKVILLDHTYKINKLGNGRSAGYAFVADETLTTVSEVLEAFKGGMSEEVVRNVKTIVVDKNPSEI